MSRFRWRGLMVVLALVAGGPLARPAGAHPILQTLVEMRVQPDRLRLHLVLPSSELVYALVQEGRIPPPPPRFLRYPDAPQPMVRDYLLRHIAAQGADGGAYRVEIARLTAPDGRLPDGDPAKDWLADIDLLPACGGPGPVRITYGIITREVINHTAILALTQDWQAGVLPDSARVIGQVQRGEQTILFRPGAGQAWRSWAQMVKMGLWHIAEGTDHQAFLLTLLLTVGLVRKKGRWRIATGRRAIISDTLWRVSAFTLGHSASLLVTSLGWLPAGGRNIEVLIAASVGLSALHAIRPIYPGKESFIAGFFGLIHGMAFATAIRDLALPAAQIVVATLAFNIGIELAQLALVVMASPLLLARGVPNTERWLRQGLGLIALIASLCWIVQRIA